MSRSARAPAARAAPGYRKRSRCRARRRGGFRGKGEDAADPAAEAEAPDDLRLDAGLDRGLRADLGLPFAAGFVALLFLHEMGHVIQLRREGVKASAPMFIPFLGAVISAKSHGPRRRRRGPGRPRRPGARNARLARAARAAGSSTGSEFWRALAYIGFFINLFNLLPVLPLDGGRAMAALTPMDLAGGIRRAARAHHLLPEPDPAARDRLRRARELEALEARDTPRAARITRSVPDPSARSPRPTSASRACSPSAWPRPISRGESAEPSSEAPVPPSPREVELDHPGLADHERPLASRGRKASKVIADYAAPTGDRSPPSCCALRPFERARRSTGSFRPWARPRC